MTWVIGIDIGGSGSRASIVDPADPDSSRTVDGERVGIAASGSSVVDVTVELLRRVASHWPDEMARVSSIGIGATGLATLVADPQAASLALAERYPGTPIAIATDAVTTHLGALGGEAGAIVAVGTGSIAFGTDLKAIWRRVDGWGHLIGDRGAGAWIGMEGIRAAALAYDGIDTEAEPLLHAARNRFGEPPTWPAQLYTRPDRAGVLASFAPDVAALAADGDVRAITTMRSAGEHVARSLAAALVHGIPPVASMSGGVFSAGGVFVDSFRSEFSRLRPEVELRHPVGSSLDGALHLARLAGVRGAVATREPHLWIAER